MTIPVDALGAAAGSTPDRVAVRAGAEALTYAELLSAARSLAHGLRTRGVEPGDRVAISLPNTPGYAVAHYAALIAGGVVVPLSPTLAVSTLAGRLRDAEPRVVIVDPGSSDPVRGVLAHAGVDAMELTGPADVVGELDPNRVAGDDPAMITYKSGDDEQPLGVVLSHRALGWSAEAAAGVLGLTGDDTAACHFPLFHPLGQTFGLGAAVAASATLMIPPPGDATATLRSAVATGATVLATFPLVAAQAVSGDARRVGADHADRDGGTVRTVFCSGGRPLPEKVRERLTAELGCEVLEGYGPAETAALGCAWRSESPATPGSMGPAVPGVTLAVVDTRGRRAASRKAGHLLVRGPHVMSGYWRRPQDSARAFDSGWLFTGDKARTDEAGNVYLLDGVLWTDSMRGRETGRRRLLRRRR